MGINHRQVLASFWIFFLTLSVISYGKYVWSWLSAAIDVSILFLSKRISANNFFRTSVSIDHWIILRFSWWGTYRAVTYHQVKSSSNHSIIKKSLLKVQTLVQNGNYVDKCFEYYYARLCMKQTILNWWFTISAKYLWQVCNIHVAILATISANTRCDIMAHCSFAIQIHICLHHHIV